MEAPKKIYLVKDRDTNKPMDYWYSATTDDSRIEYIRKDAFIEKACEFLKDRIEHDSIEYPMATKYLIEDFKKYMEDSL